jgi:sensor histidine kinase regulating citrate/malate metabolism
LRLLEGEENEFNLREQELGTEEILVDRILITEEGKRNGAVGILHNRKEYTKLMEDLAGTRYLVDSMRANNHDFNNKLHVILGLLQMEKYEDAASYVEQITMVQRQSIHKIMESIEEPAIAAILIGKTARAAEMNVKFTLREGSNYGKEDISLPLEDLVTIIGNLIDNGLEAAGDEENGPGKERELLFGIYTHPGALVITADDTGVGISPKDQEHIYENGFSTKGEGRGTGLYQVKHLVESLGGTISLESQVGTGTSIIVSVLKK